MVRVCRGVPGSGVPPSAKGKVFWSGKGSLDIRRGVRRVGFRCGGRKYFDYEDNLQIVRKARGEVVRISYRPST